MKAAIIGVDEDGKSCVSRIDELPLKPGEFTQQVLWSTDESLPVVPVPRRDKSDPVEIWSASPTGSTFLHTVVPPNFESGMHRTDTLDYGIVLEGDVALILENGQIELQAGDYYVIPGLLHQWRFGPKGATVCVILLGLGLPEEG